MFSQREALSRKEKPYRLETLRQPRFQNLPRPAGPPQPLAQLPLRPLCTPARRRAAWTTAPRPRFPSRGPTSTATAHRPTPPSRRLLQPMQAPPDMSPAAEPVARETRSVYIAPEPIFEEPDWDDLGLSPDMPPAASAAAHAAPKAPKAAPVSLTPVQAAAPTPAVPTPAAPPFPSGPPPAMSPVQRPPAQATRPDDVQATPVQATPTQPALTQPVRPRTAPQPTQPPPQPLASGLQDLRAHPLYQEATRMWSGRVREVGKVKLALKVETDAELDAAELDAAEVLADEELV